MTAFGAISINPLFLGSGKNSTRGLSDSFQLVFVMFSAISITKNLLKSIDVIRWSIL